MDNKELLEADTLEKENLTEKDLATIPFFVHEAQMERMEQTLEKEREASERHLKRAWIINIILVFLIAIISIGFIIYEGQFETISIVQDAYNDKEGGTATITDVQVGNTYYGIESETNDQN